MYMDCIILSTKLANKVCCSIWGPFKDDRETNDFIETVSESFRLLTSRNSSLLMHRIFVSLNKTSVIHPSRFNGFSHQQVR